MRAIGVLASFMVMVCVTAAKADFQFTTLSFPGYMKIIVEAEMKPVPKVDYLFVIDDSGSMSSHQNNLAHSIEALVQVLAQSKVDFHAAIISTDPTNGNGYKSGEFRGAPSVISPQTPDAIGVLRRNLILGTSGSGNEEVFGPLQWALSEPLLSGPNQ
ncbi:MAG: hypothetical protein KDD43_02715, partial [Bdellovibrionales bacterium]|nr:hypothetical protein [Bdellovibrionales bacterium]